MSAGLGLGLSLDAEDPWEVLGVPTTADDAAVRAAYRAGIRVHRPETDPVGFKRLRVAYEALRDAPARARTAVFGGFRVPALPPVTHAALGVRPFAPPVEAELLADWRAVLLADTVLTATDFTADLRTPPA